MYISATYLEDCTSKYYSI